MYHHRTSLGPVELAFTDRHGGASAAPRDSLDLSLDPAPGATSPDRVDNLRLLLADFAPYDTLADLEQVHGREVVVADPAAGSATGRRRADGIVTSGPGVTLMVRAADCVPVLLADPYAGVVGAAHSGRQGLLVGVVAATVARMRELGARDLTAWVGPHVCGSCYEVPPDLQAQVVAREPSTRATTSWGTTSLDLGAGVRAQLEREGATVVDVSRCTLESTDLFSYRRDGPRAGRLAGLIRLAGSIRQAGPTRQGDS